MESPLRQLLRPKSNSEDALRSVSEKRVLTLQREDKKKNQKGMANNR